MLVRKKLPFILAAALAAALAIPATYAALRIFDVLVRPPEPNPATIVWSAKIAMFWRLAISAYVAGMVVPAAYLAARKNLAKTLGVLYACVFLASAMIAVQGILMP